jgi:hypothetical protein
MCREVNRHKQQQQQPTANWAPSVYRLTVAGKCRCRMFWCFFSCYLQMHESTPHHHCQQQNEEMFRIVFWDHPWWWRQYAPLKRWSTVILHGSTSQKTILNIILAAMRTWNLTEWREISSQLCNTQSQIHVTYVYPCLLKLSSSVQYCHSLLLA